MLSRRCSVTICMTTFLVLIIANSAMNINYQDIAIAQITPAAGLVDRGGNAEDTDEGVISSSDDNKTQTGYPITPSFAPSSNISESASPIEKKYSVTPEHNVSAEESLVGGIFNKVNEDLIASGITGFYP